MSTQSASKFHDINMPGFSSGKSQNENSSSTDSNNQEEEQQRAEPEVRIISAEWAPGPQGYEYNKQCFLDVKTEYLKKTARARIRGKLFGIYNNEELDLGHEVEGFIDAKTNIARLNIKYLFFINNDHYSTWQKDPGVKAQYLIKKIFHTCGENEIDSPKLDMPAGIRVDFIELPDVLFNHNSAVPCIDNSETLTGAIVATLIYAKNHSDKEIIIFGHTDSSGETDFNVKLSEERAQAIKALVDKDKDAFVKVCDNRHNIEDVQTILSTLTKLYGWSCDPGTIDNVDGAETQQALKFFQSDYNDCFSKSITVDGKIGAETWGAFFDVIHQIIWLNASSEVGEQYPKMKYGKGGKGIHPCGESFAQDANAKKGRKSKKDRRVEIVFKKPDDPIEDTPYTDTIVMAPVIIKPIKNKPAITKSPDLTGFTLYCEHNHKDPKKRRCADNTFLLEIVPDVQGDKVTCCALPDEKSIKAFWNTEGHIDKSGEGKEITFNVPGFNAAKPGNYLRALLIGALDELIPPKKVLVHASDKYNNKVTGKIVVYPNNVVAYTIDFSKVLSWIDVVNTNINKILSFTGHNFKAKALVGKVGYEGGYKEQAGSNLAFFQFIIKGGFDPLIGFDYKNSFPLLNIANKLPDAIKKWLGHLEGGIIIKGGASLFLNFKRTSIEMATATALANGSLVVGLFIDVNVLSGKILILRFLASAGVELPYEIELAKNPNKESFQLMHSARFQFTGIKGELTWIACDGRFTRNNKITIVDPSVILNMPSRPLFPPK